MNKYKYSVCCLLGLVTVISCKKKEAPYEEHTDSKKNVNVYVTKSSGNMQGLNIFPFVDEARTMNIAASFGGVGYPKNEIPLKFIVDNKAFDSLNVIRTNSGLAPYLKFPADAYAISSLNAAIPAGGLTSNDITVSYFSKKFDSTKDYLLPLTLADANGYQIGTSKTIFLVAAKVQEYKAPTTGWTVSASSEQPTGETTGKATALIDGDLTTIWHAQYSGGQTTVYPHWVQFDMQVPMYVTKVSVAPRQNNGTGPTLLRIEGSLNGTTWSTLLDNQIFDPNKRDGTYQDYTLPAPTNLRYIKVTLLAGKQALAFLSEIAIYRY